MRHKLVLTLLLTVTSFVYAYSQDCPGGTSYRNCPAEGTAKSDKGKELDRCKNRDEAVTSPQEITVKEIRSPKNNDKFSTSRQVWVKGYVASVVSGGMPENCNCSRQDLRDIHINVVATPSERNNQQRYVVVEFTPRWEAKFGLDDSSYTKMLKKVRNEITHKWVRFEGWMLYDYFHENAAKSTRPKQPVCTHAGQKKCNWRATPWEIHPVTKYTVVEN